MVAQNRNYIVRAPAVVMHTSCQGIASGDLFAKIKFYMQKDDRYKTATFLFQNVTHYTCVRSLGVVLILVLNLSKINNIKTHLKEHRICRTDNKILKQNLGVAFKL